MAEMLGNNYSPREILEEVFLNTENLLATEKLWFCAWCYRCQQRCPQALNLPEIFLFLRSKAAKEEGLEAFERALQEIVKNIPLPMITTLICFHPERAGLDKKNILKKIGQIHQQQLDTIIHAGKRKDTHSKVAVIGSGPAGLTVAYELALDARLAACPGAPLARQDSEEGPRSLLLDDLPVRVGDRCRLPRR